MSEAPTGVPRPGPVARMTDSGRLERVVRLFEERGAGRYTIPTGHLRGLKAPGCDVLSFATAEDREAYKSSNGQALNRVARFIEVKGSKNEHGKIGLKGNELRAAQRFGARYFLYRVYDAGEGTLEIRVLCEPAGEAIEFDFVRAIELRRQTTTKHYTMTGVADSLLPG